MQSPVSFSNRRIALMNNLETQTCFIVIWCGRGLVTATTVGAQASVQIKFTFYTEMGQGENNKAIL